MIAGIANISDLKDGLNLKRVFECTVHWVCHLITELAESLPKLDR